MSYQHLTICFNESRKSFWFLCHQAATNTTTGTTAKAAIMTTMMIIAKIKKHTHTLTRSNNKIRWRPRHTHEMLKNFRRGYLLMSGEKVRVTAKADRGEKTTSIYFGQNKLRSPEWTII